MSNSVYCMRLTQFINLYGLCQSTLEEIASFMRRQSKKKLLAVFTSQGRMDDDITELIVKLEDAFRLFNVGFSFTRSFLTHTNSYVNLSGSCGGRNTSTTLCCRRSAAPHFILCRPRRSCRRTRPGTSRIDTERRRRAHKKEVKRIRRTRGSLLLPCAPIGASRSSDSI